MSPWSEPNVAPPPPPPLSTYLWTPGIWWMALGGGGGGCERTGAGSCAWSEGTPEFGGGGRPLGMGTGAEAAR